MARAKKTALQLGRKVSLPDSPQRAMLDAVPNPQSDSDYVVRFYLRLLFSFIGNP